MASENDIFVELGVFGETLIPEQITEILKVNPTKAALKGELKFGPKSPVRRKGGKWIYKVYLKEPWIIDEGLDILIKILEEAPELQKVMQPDWTIQLAVVMVCDDYIPGFHIDKNMLKRIVNLNAELDVDLYIARDSEN